MKVYVVAEDEKCGCCNCPAGTLYLIADSEEEAEKIYKQRGKGGLCADCLVRYVIGDREITLNTP